MRTSRSRRARTAAAVATSALALVACDSGSTRDTVDARATTTATPSPTAGAAESAPPAESPAAGPTAAPGRMTVPVYYLVETRRGVRLQREFRQVARTTTPVRSAVETMLQQPALDRDYTSLWPKTTTVRGLSRSGATLTVDLSREALDGRGGAEATAMSLQQLVHTVTAADTTVKSVRLLVEGRAVTDFWGHVSATEPMRRRPHVEVLAFVSIDSPAETAEVGQTFTISGTATVFEANVQWKITRGCPADVTCVGDKPVYRSGFVTASEGAPGRGTWSVRVTLPDEVFDTAGYIEITAFEESAEDGSVANSDTKVVHATR